MTEPDNDSESWDDLENWQPRDEPCPQCGAPAETGSWWDDHPDNGGACIGTLLRCTACDWFESV